MSTRSKLALHISVQDCSDALDFSNCLIHPFLLFVNSLFMLNNNAFISQCNLKATDRNFLTGIHTPVAVEKRVLVNAFINSCHL